MDIAKILMSNCISPFKFKCRICRKRMYLSPRNMNDAHAACLKKQKFKGRASCSRVPKTGIPEIDTNMSAYGGYGGRKR